MTAVRSLLVLAALALCAGIAPPDVRAMPAQSPSPSGSVSEGGFGVAATTRTRHDEGPIDVANPRQFSCVQVSGPGVAVVSVGDPCGVAGRVCPPVVAAGSVVTEQISNATELAPTINVDCVATPPVEDAALVTAAHGEFSRRVPVVIKSAPPVGGQVLVQVEVLFWLDTTPEVDLGSAVLLGQSVRLLASVQSVRWAFGDNTTGTSQGPGRVFGRGDFCATRQCPGWFGHTYTETATSVPVTAAATWLGRYSVNGGPFQLITGTGTVTPTTIALHVVQPRTVLIPNPTPT